MPKKGKGKPKGCEYLLVNTCSQPPVMPQGTVIPLDSEMAKNRLMPSIKTENKIIKSYLCFLWYTD